MNWPMAAIGEVCDVVSGATPKTGEPGHWGGDIRWATPKDLSELGQKYIADTPRKITEQGLRSCSARMLPAQSVLFSSRAPIGLVAINTVPMCTNQGFKSLVPRNGAIATDYLYWWLKVHRSQMEGLGRGATFKEISKKLVQQIKIPLPPPVQQKRIARILDAADSLRARRRESLAQLDALLQSTFLDLFGDPVTNPKGWRVGQLADVVERLDGGKNVAKSETQTEFRVLKVSAVTSGTYKPDESKYLPVDFRVPDSSVVRQGDLLISRANTVELIGATAYVWHTPENIVLPDKIWKFVWKSDVEIEPLFVYHLSRKTGFRRALSSRASGTSGSMKNIAKSKLLGLSIPLPPIDLQHRFATIVEAVEQQKARLRAHLAELDALFASLEARAFNGEL